MYLGSSSQQCQEISSYSHTVWFEMTAMQCLNRDGEKIIIIIINLIKVQPSKVRFYEGTCCNITEKGLDINLT